MFLEGRESSNSLFRNKALQAPSDISPSRVLGRELLAHRRQLGSLPRNAPELPVPHLNPPTRTRTSLSAEGFGRAAESLH